MREYRIKNLETIKAKEKIHRENNGEKIYAANKIWRAANKETLKIKKRQYAIKNKESIREKHRQLYLKNRKKYIEASRVRYEANKIEINAVRKAEHRRDPRVVMFNGAKVRARKKNMVFDLAIEDIVVPEFCPVLDIPLVVGDGFRSANSPSLDRVDSRLGYTRSNCRVISFKANTLKNDGTIEDHERVIAYMKGER